MTDIVLYRPARTVCVKPAPPRPTGLTWPWALGMALTAAAAWTRLTTRAYAGADESYADELAAINPENTGRHYAHNIRPVGPGYRLSPAARQLVAPTPEAVHADVTDSTGLLPRIEVTA